MKLRVKPPKLSRGGNLYESLKNKRAEYPLNPETMPNIRNQTQFKQRDSLPKSREQTSFEISFNCTNSIKRAPSSKELPAIMVYIKNSRF